MALVSIAVNLPELIGVTVILASEFMRRQLNLVDLALDLATTV